jgi:hypothetical protein
VRYLNHGHAFVGDLHHGDHLPDQFGVQRASGLVEHHQMRVHRRRAGNGDALLLTTGEL